MSNDCFERTTRWVPCADGIRLWSLHSIRFLTSLVRICLDLFRSNRTLIGIGDWHSFLVLTLLCRVSYKQTNNSCTKPQKSCVLLRNLAILLQMIEFALIGGPHFILVAKLYLSLSKTLFVSVYFLCPS